MNKKKHHKLQISSFFVLVNPKKKRDFSFPFEILTPTMLESNLSTIIVPIILEKKFVLLNQLEKVFGLEAFKDQTLFSI